MEVAAAGFGALLRCQPDALWTPPLGVLYVRMLVAPWSHEVAFCYTDDAAQPMHYRTIARIVGWRGEPDFGGWVSGDKGDVGTTGAGAAIVRRLAYREDIEALAKLWQHRVTLEEWARNVAERQPALCVESKAMIAEALTFDRVCLD